MKQDISLSNDCNSLPLLAELSLVALLLIIALYLRLPFISAGMPFFYDEDEGHHFNRLVEMAQSGDLNPHYFHKPSLHFYLRLIPTYAAIKVAISRGELREIGQVITRDKFGLARYAWSASHPIVAKAARAVTTLLSLLLVLFAFLLARKVSSFWPALAAGFIVALSPPLIRDSAKIGTDTLLAALSVISVYAAILTHQKFSLLRLLGTGVLCGLTISAKYNGAPIAALPFVIVLLSEHRNLKTILVALFSPMLGFFLGSPYILISLPLFYEQLSYEVWHYAVAGHEGHTGTPGIGQLLFYGNWLNHDALGTILLALGIFGFIVAARRHHRSDLVVGAFPVMFLLLMIMQKVNFTRNMLPIVPFIAIAAVVGAESILQFRSKSLAKLTAYAALLIGIAIIALPAIRLSNNARNQLPDSRTLAESWLSINLPSDSQLAIDGELQFSGALRLRPGVKRFAATELNLVSLFQNGFEFVAANPSIEQTPIPNGIRLEKLVEFPGTNEEQRIVNSPYISIYRLRLESPAALLAQSEGTSTTLILPTDGALDATRCYASQERNDFRLSNEKYCWIRARVTSLSFPELARIKRAKKISLSIMTPWKLQSCKIISAQGMGSVNLCSGLTPGEWQQRDLNLTPDSFQPNGTVIIEIERLASPKSMGLGADTRSLGVAIAHASIVD